jgi:peroxiredoxin/predicted 2-oxoglutarate/Fe(II)-dependent dioxygenase YbiX
MASLTVGDPVPWFILPSTSNPNYHFDTVGGYRVVLFFFGSTAIERSAQAIQDFCAMQAKFAALNVPFFGVSVDPNDQGLADIVEDPTYCKFLWDFEQTVSQQYGVCSSSTTDAVAYRPTSFILDENLHVLKVFPLDQSDHYAAEILAYVSSLPDLDPPVVAARQAPVLFIPRVLDPDFCRTLIQLHQTQGGRDSGFMREVDGKTVEILDYGFKKRRDINLADTPLLDTINHLVLRRVKPEIEKAYQFSITRFERHIVACYDSANQGFFNRHRDNTTKGTAHRRFAMTLNLNTGEYEGGYLHFPEYGRQLYRPETGEAVIFSCSLLHEATPVTNGQRFALLSFFYGDEDALVRERNRRFLADKPQPTEQASEQKSSSVIQASAKSTAKSTLKTAGFQPKTKKRR